MARPRILVSNDDGINAPGIKALVNELLKADFCDVYVCAPSGERSAQSHAITLGRYLSCVPQEGYASVEAYAVDGTPADSVMLALCSPVFQNVVFDLVVSGINRGDNCGLHVIYSGTVGAAREAACKGIPAIALSLDNHLARKADDYSLCAALSVPLVRAALGLLPGDPHGAAAANGAANGSGNGVTDARPPAARLKGVVVNVNFPIGQGQMLQGMYLARQSIACVFPAFKEVTEAPGPHLAEIDEHTPNSRIFRNYAGLVQEDQDEGGDAWALKNGWISVTPLSLLSHVTSRPDARADSIVGAVSEIVSRAAAEAGLQAGGLSKL